MHLPQREASVLSTEQLLRLHLKREVQKIEEPQMWLKAFSRLIWKTLSYFLFLLPYAEYNYKLLGYFLHSTVELNNNTPRVVEALGRFCSWLHRC